MNFDFSNIKSEFPVFKNNPGLIYLDSAATSLKPRIVIDKIVEYYEKYPANIKRGVYKLSEKATEEYEKSRKIITDFINAKTNEVIFTSGTTESINLIAYSLGREIVGEKDEVVISMMEHHSNFVPWQVLSTEVGADFKIIDITTDGKLDLGKDFEYLNRIITKKTKIVALTYISNALGTINPIKEIIGKIRKINPLTIIVIDAAQALACEEIDVQDLNSDFIAFSSHKLFGPTGVGILWGRAELLEKMFPFKYGGEMIREVSIDKTIFADPPEKFEAGTPAIAEVIGFGKAVEYINRIGVKNIRLYTRKLMEYFLNELKEKIGEKVKIVGLKNVKGRSSIVAFNLPGIHPHDLASYLDEKNICIRAGHHCTMPLHKSLGLNATARVSFSVYNNKEDIDILIKHLKNSLGFFYK